MKKLIILSLILMNTSCTYKIGRFVNGRCRPKPPFFLTKFSNAFRGGKWNEVVKKPDVINDKLTYFKVYLQKNGVNDFPKNKALRGYGFYPDGRLVFLGYEEKRVGLKKNLKSKVFRQTTWDTANYIGYWEIEGDQIELKFFGDCAGVGGYYRETATIDGDTIHCNELPYLSFILSDMKFENGKEISK